MEIENTVKNFTGAPSRDFLAENAESTGSLPKPLVPTPASVSAPKGPAPGPPKTPAPAPPQASKPSIPQKPLVETRAHPVLQKKTSADEDGGQGLKPKRGSYKVLKIDNIPSKSAGGVEDRYVNAVTNDHHTVAEKKLSYISTDSGKEDLQAKKEMFENSKPTGQPEHPVKSNVNHQKPVDLNSNSVISNKPNIEPKVEKRNSNPNTGTAALAKGPTPQDKKFVTVLSVGSGPAPKPSVNRTTSTPQNQVMPKGLAPESKVKTLPPKSTQPYYDMPQSSIPPPTPPTQSGNSVYSLAGNPYSAVANHSSGEVTSSPRVETGNEYSYPTVPNMSRVNGIKSDQGSLYSYSSVNNTNNGNNRSSQNSNDLNMYSAVEKSGRGPLQQPSVDDSYDFVAVGKNAGNSSQV